MYVAENKPQPEERVRSFRPLAVLLFVASTCFAFLAKTVAEGGLPGPNTFSAMQSGFEHCLLLPESLLAALLGTIAVAMWKRTGTRSLWWIGAVIAGILFIWILDNTVLITNNVRDDIFGVPFSPVMFFAFFLLTVGTFGLVAPGWNENEGALLCLFFAAGFLACVLCHRLAFVILNNTSMCVVNLKHSLFFSANAYCGGTALILFIYCWLAGGRGSESWIKTTHGSVPRSAKLVFISLAGVSLLHAIVPLFLLRLETPDDVPWRTILLPWGTGGPACLLQVGAAGAGAYLAARNPMRALFAGFVSGASLLCSALINAGFISNYRFPSLRLFSGPILLQDLPTAASQHLLTDSYRLVLASTMAAAMLVSVVSLPVLFVQLHPHGIGETPAAGPCGADGSGES